MPAGWRPRAAGRAAARGIEPLHVLGAGAGPHVRPPSTVPWALGPRLLTGLPALHSISLAALAVLSLCACCGRHVVKFKVSKGNKYNNNEIMLKAREVETGGAGCGRPQAC